MFKKTIWTLLALALLFSAVFPFKVMASVATLSVQPQTTEIEGVQESFAVNVTVTDVTNLYGWEFKVYYSSAILNGTGIDEGPLLQTGGAATSFDAWFNDAYNTTHGRVWAYCTRLGNISGVDGTGVLATITFKTKRVGNCPLQLDDTLLGTPEATPIQHTVYDGYVEVKPGVNTPPSISGLPDLELDEDTVLDNAIDLWNYASDLETLVEDLTFTILSVDYPALGITIDSNRYIDVHPAANWNGKSSVNIKVSDPDGLTDTDIFDVTVYAVNDPPVVSDIPDQTIEEGGTFVGIPLDNYVEDFDNADSEITWTYSGNVNLVISISADRVAAVSVPSGWHGTETVTFTAKDPHLQTDSDQATFTVIVKPNVAFSWSPSYPEVGETVTFDASTSTPGSGYILNYKWDFDGDGVIDQTTFEKTATHTYATFGEYLVTLKVTNSEGRWDTESKMITVTAEPHADFTWSPYSPQVNEEVTFDASASTPDGGTIVLYEWAFGDGSYGNGKIVVHKFLALGTFTVMLNVLDSEGKYDFVSKLITVTAAQERPPHADFTWSPYSPQVNEEVTFDASASTPDGGTIVLYEWAFGDGSYGNGKIVVHKFLALGTFTVTLNIMDSEGKQDFVPKLITVTATQVQQPNADFSWSPSYPEVGETVTFDASASTPDGGYIISYTWNFGDGTPSIIEDHPTATHQYAVPGNYTVTLTVEDSEDKSDTTSKAVEIRAPPPDVPHADYTWSPLSPQQGETVTFDASASTPNGGYIVDYTWNFGDGNITTTTAPIITHAYTNVGSYYVILNVTDSQGLWDIATGYVTVRSPGGLTGDLNNDGIVDIFDIVIFVLAFGSEPGDSNWNPDADLNNDGVIDIFDAVLIILYFGKTP